MGQRHQAAAGVDAGGEALGGGRLKIAAAHVVLARPGHLHRTIDRLRHLGRLGGIVGEQPAAEAAAHHHAVQRDRRLRQAGHLGDLRQRPHISLGRRPDLGASGLHVRGAVHRLHRCVRLERKDVSRLVTPDRAVHRRKRVALVAHLEGRRSQAAGSSERNRSESNAGPGLVPHVIDSAARPRSADQLSSATTATPGRMPLVTPTT